MAAPPYRQCTRCVMDTSDPEIRFDNEGQCNHCTGQIENLKRLRKQKGFGPEHFDEAVERIRRAGAGRKYDAVLGISGGVDSSYLALRLSKLGLRLLLVHVDNGWNSHAAVRNIASVARAIGADYESYVLDWHEFRQIQLAFLRASVVEAETPTDMALAGAIHRVAARHRVPTIISASNESSEGILPRLWHYNSKDIRYFRSINRKYGEGTISAYPSFGFAREAYDKFVRGIRMAYPLNLIEYDPAAALDELRRAAGWVEYGGKHHESHYTRFVQSYLLPRKFGLDYRKATYSSLICAGRMTREAALAKLESPPFEAGDVDSQKSYIALKLGISGEELDELIDRPGRYYYELPNNEGRLQLAYSAYKLFVPLFSFRAFSRQPKPKAK